jgi:hypothetical protein
MKKALLFNSTADATPISQRLIFLRGITYKKPAFRSDAPAG